MLTPFTSGLEPGVGVGVGVGGMGVGVGVGVGVGGMGVGVGVGIQHDSGDWQHDSGDKVTQARNPLDPWYSMIFQAISGSTATVTILAGTALSPSPSSASRVGRLAGFDWVSYEPTTRMQSAIFSN